VAALADAAREAGVQLTVISARDHDFRPFVGWSCHIARTRTGIAPCSSLSAVALSTSGSYPESGAP
jgi:hypothetical protein